MVRGADRPNPPGVWFLAVVAVLVMLTAFHHGSGGGDWLSDHSSRESKKRVVFGATLEKESPASAVNTAAATITPENLAQLLQMGSRLESIGAQVQQLYTKQIKQTDGLSNVRGPSHLTEQNRDRGSPRAKPAREPKRSYHSSKWEQLWLDNIAEWQGKRNHDWKNMVNRGTICEQLQAQEEEYVWRFMNSTCTHRTNTPWCLIDDTVNKLWYSHDRAPLSIPEHTK